MCVPVHSIVKYIYCGGNLQTASPVVRFAFFLLLACVPLCVVYNYFLCINKVIKLRLAFLYDNPRAFLAVLFLASRREVVTIFFVLEESQFFFVRVLFFLLTDKVSFLLINERLSI